MAETSSWIRVATTSEVDEGQMIPLEVKGHSLALYNLGGGEWRCTANVCTHAFALLTDGWFEDGIIECPLHAGRFDVRTGKGLGAPIDDDIQTYAVKLEGDDVLVDVPG